MLEARYRKFHRTIRQSIPSGRIFHDELSRLAYGTDASFYRLIPQLVVKAENEQEVTEVLRLARAAGISLTFRAAGTSLSGQAVTDSVLVIMGQGWNQIKVSPDGSFITLQPGVIGGRANLALEPFGRKIGPDPASINSAMIGGIAANNASGMCCGISQNSYQTLKSMRIIFADGSLLDTGDSQSRGAFSGSHEAMLARLSALRERVLKNTVLAEKIRAKFKMKNTTGYSLNALVDFEDPVDILQHLMIGSEGTLGFISGITLKTVPDYPFKASSLMFFKDMQAACSAVTAFSKLEASACEDGDIKSPRACRSHGASAAELMDRACLKSVQNKPGMPAALKNLGRETVALLVEVSVGSQKDLESMAENIFQAVKPFSPLEPPVFNFDPAECAKLWNIRKGLFPSIGAMREAGTTVIIEDVAFPLERLADAACDLQKLFLKHGYEEAILFGHALQGNLHFVFTQDFNQADEVSRYERLMEDVTKLVAEGYGGSLKAEHGTGRNMAPFVEREWGSEAYLLMKEIKKIFDPDGLLNPGVILNGDPKIHVKNLKPLPKAHPVIDKCIECGFCESNCPSKNLTLTPRQRIVVFREMTRLKAENHDKGRLRRLEKAFQYQGEKTCAADGVCAIHCPVDIDTGRLIKMLRYEKHSRLAHAAAGFTASHMKEMTVAARCGLELLAAARRLIGTKNMERISRTLSYLPGPAPRFAPPAFSGRVPRTVIYFPSCLSRTLGAQGEQHRSLLSKAGWDAVYPERLEDLCCGLAFASKGFKVQGDKKLKELESALRQASEEGTHPVLFDTSPCLMRMKEGLFDQKFSSALYEPVEFIEKFLLERLEFRRFAGTVANHVTCSARKMGLAERQKKILELCAEQVIDTGAVCCGFAGDKGWTVPELAASALGGLKERLPQDCEGGYSTSLTCEMGLSQHSGIAFSALVHLVDRCTQKMDQGCEDGDIKSPRA